MYHFFYLSIAERLVRDLNPFAVFLDKFFTLYIWKKIHLWFSLNSATKQKRERDNANLRKCQKTSRAWTCREEVIARVYPIDKMHYTIVDTRLSARIFDQVLLLRLERVEVLLVGLVGFCCLGHVIVLRLFVVVAINFELK